MPLSPPPLKQSRLGSALLLTISAAYANHESDHLCIESVPLTEQQEWEKEKLPIGEIHIRTLPIFDESDPEENNWLFRFANRMHVDTQSKVLEDDLLFDKDGAYVITEVAESERILRNRKYLRGAKIEAVKNCDSNKIDIDVSAHEVWTLLPEIGYSHKGGATTYRYGIKDNNFLGSGKQVSIQRENDPERTSTEIGYNDPNWGSTHGILDLEYGDTSDGKYYNVELKRPFYSLNTPRSAAVFAHDAKRVDSLFFRGDSIQSYAHRDASFGLQYGISDGLKNGASTRWTLGISDKLDRFDRVEDSVAGEPIPGDRRYRYPWLGWEWLQDNFVKAVNVNQIHIVEDLNLGWSVYAQMGYASTDLGSEQNAYLFQASVNRSFLIGDDKVVVLDSSLNGYYQDQHLIQSIAGLNLRYHHGDFNTHQFYAGLNANYGQRLFLDQPIYLGGDNGLRGYPSHYQLGDRSVLLTLEQRWFSSYEFLKLFDVGGAAFFDVGRSWYADRDNGENGDWLKDAGFGLRLSPTRIGSHHPGHHNVVHMDMAFPLDRASDISRWQWLVQVKQSF